MKDMTQDQILQFRSKLLQTLSGFNQFCEKYNIGYYAAYGTVIGAIRHNGLIPWDDDIDVYMLRDDYERFKNLNKEALQLGYRIEGPQNKGYTAMFSKFVDNNTTLWENERHPYTIGVYIDVFPLDYTDGNKDNFLRKYKSLRRSFFSYLRINHHSTWEEIKTAIKTKAWSNFLGVCRSIVTSGFNSDKAYKKFESVERELKRAPSDYLASYTAPYGIKELYDASWFLERKWVDFEGMKIAVPVGYDSYLRRLYGDYMRLPPMEKRISHHFHYYVNFDKYLTVEEVREIIKNSES